MNVAEAFLPSDWAQAIAREHTEPFGGGVAPFSLDRTRVVRSASFRRLQHKTQVFVATEADHFRTRMTHSLEVADLSRRVATALGLNSELAEVVALTHDLGHPPFGHAGERALDELLQEHGGFEHNAHALRVVEFLEHPYPEFRGLNLTRVVRECLAKHATRYDQPGPHPLQDPRPAPLEGQIVALADRLTYALHDLEDGLFAGLISTESVHALALWRLATDAGGDAEAGLSELRPGVDRMQAALIRDVIETTRATWRAAGVADARYARGLDQAGIALSRQVESKVEELEGVLRRDLYRSSRLSRMDSKARRVLAALFDAYVAEPQLMPRRYAERATGQGAWRVAADYLAGMTDRFAIREHARLFDPTIEV